MKRKRSDNHSASDPSFSSMSTNPSSSMANSAERLYPTLEERQKKLPPRAWAQPYHQQLLNAETSSTTPADPVQLEQMALGGMNQNQQWGFTSTINDVRSPASTGTEGGEDQGRIREVISKLRKARKEQLENASAQASGSTNAPPGVFRPIRNLRSRDQQNSKSLYSTQASRSIDHDGASRGQTPFPHSEPSQTSTTPNAMIDPALRDEEDPNGPSLLFRDSSKSSLGSRGNVVTYTPNIAGGQQQAGHEYDTLLQVFDKDFFVSSVVLKVHSFFFRSFMDSADKNPPQPGAKYKYHWVSVVEPDGGWALVDRNNAKSGGNLLTNHVFKGNVQAEIKSFNTLLSIFWNKSVEIECFEHLRILVEQAYYYQATQSVSAAISHSLDARMSPRLVADIRPNCAEILALADKLKINTLYKESMLYCMGPWTDPLYMRIEDEELREKARGVYDHMCNIIHRTELAMQELSMKGKYRYHLQYASGPESPYMLLYNYSKKNSGYQADWQNKENLISPSNYRYLLGRLRVIDEATDLLAPLLTNTLQWNSTGAQPGAEGLLKDYFLFDVADIEVPLHYDD